MQIPKAIAFPFRGPNAWPNLGCVALCMLIPIVGPLVVNGYQIVIEKRLIENPDADAPRFTFNRFSDYLLRGVWPFLVTLVAMFVVVPFIITIIFFFAMAAILLQNHTAWMIAVIVVGGTFYLASFLALGPLLLPLILRSGLIGTFQAGFDAKFILDFFRRVGLLTIGIQLLLMLMMIPAMMVSFCIPYLGMFALITILTFVQTHITVQLYLTYLDRGGTPIPFTPDPPDPAFPVIIPPPPTPLSN